MYNPSFVMFFSFLKKEKNQKKKLFGKTPFFLVCL